MREPIPIPEDITSSVALLYPDADLQAEAIAIVRHFHDRKQVLNVDPPSFCRAMLTLAEGDIEELRRLAAIPDDPRDTILQATRKLRSLDADEASDTDTDDIEPHAHSFDDDDWPFDAPHNTTVYSTQSVVHDGAPLLTIAHDNEGDWQFLDGNTDDPDNIAIVCFGCMFEHHPEIGAFHDLPCGAMLWRDSPDDEWTYEVMPPDDTDENDDA